MDATVAEKEEMEEKVRRRFGHRLQRVQKSTISSSRPHYFDL